MTPLLVVSIAAVVVGVAIVAVVVLVLRGQRDLAQALAEATKNTVAKSDLESLRTELGTVAQRVEHSHAEMVERHDSIEASLAEVVANQAMQERELAAIRQESKVSRTTQADIMLAVQRTLPDLRPTPVLAHRSFEQVFLGQTLTGSSASEEEATWVKSVLRKLKSSSKFKSLPSEQKVKVEEGAALLLSGVAGVFNLAEANKELIAQWVIESAATGGVPITTLAVGLITAPIKAKLGDVGLNVQDLIADGQRSRVSALQATFGALRRIAQSPVPDNRATLLDIQRQLDEQKHYFRRLLRERAVCIKDPSLLAQWFNRKRAEAGRNAEFDAFCGHLLVYKQLLGLDLLTAMVLNDPDVTRATLVALEEESARLEAVLADIQKHWEGTKGYRKELPEPALLEEMRMISAETCDKVQAMQLGEPLLAVGAL